MRQELLDKYNIPVPRYTSHPPANYFHEGFQCNDYADAIHKSNQQLPQSISFYFHIPFCQRLCHYCGCNSYPAPKDEIRERYVAALHKEIDLVLPLIAKNRKISQIHYGGGTPTILAASVLKDLNDHVLSNFKTIDTPEIAIECHPGWIDENGWKELTSAGFNRMSLGVQDFKEDVLNTVHRRPSLLPMEEVVDLLRSAHIRINMDFLYGLPHQSESSFAATIERAATLRPDRLVTFSYAHVPWAFPRQKAVERAGIPSSEEKGKMFEAARRILCEADYQPIGLDHFVQKDDELYTALMNGQLHRNFQGYCTRRTTGQVYAFGVTGISQLTTAYVQNTKDIMEYIEKVEAGILPVAKGYALSREEQITREVIEILMCNYRLDWNEVAEHLSLPVEEVKAATAYNEARLAEFTADGLIEYDNQRIQMTADGRLFVRNVAASLDKLMLGTTKSFSKPV